MLTSLILVAVATPNQGPANPMSLGSVISEPTAPKLVVLLHGASPGPSDEAFPSVPQPDSNTLDFTRFYFSDSFVKQVLGNPSTLKTLGGVNVTGTQWDAHGWPNAKNKVVYSNGCVESRLEDHYIVAGSHTGSSTPAVSVMLTYRDASRGLMHQTQTAIDQIYDKYVALFGSAASPLAGKVRPNIILVGHSMGGLVSRGILCSPSDPIQQIRLSATQQQKAKAIADRTIALVTLATPHEGSPIANVASDLGNWLKGDGKGVIDLFTTPLPQALKRAADDARKEKVQMLSRESIRDLRRDFWAQNNTGVLAPHRAARSDGSLIPVYTLIGHSPGGKTFFSNPDSQWPTGGISLSDSSSEAARRKALRALGLMFADYALHNVPNASNLKKWGNAGRSQFDLVARYHRKNLGVTLSEPGEDQGVPFGVPKFYNRDHVTKRERDLFGNEKVVVVRTNKDGLLDADGLVDVASGHGFKLGTNTEFYFDHTRTYSAGGRTVRGSWYRVMPEDGWKFANHEEIHRLGSTGQWIHLNIVDQAGPLSSTGELSVWPVSNRLPQRLRLPGKLRKPTIQDPP
jgi:hypothetical protein